VSRRSQSDLFLNGKVAPVPGDVGRTTAALIDALTRSLGPPVATPEWISVGAGKRERARYRVFRWRCPACQGGWGDPDLIWRPLVVDSDGNVWCEAPGCSDDRLAEAFYGLRVGA
jgi:hypothetical protein